MRKAKRAKSKLKLCVFICAEFQLKAGKARRGKAEPAKSPHCCVATSQQVVLARLLEGRFKDSPTGVALNLTFARLCVDVSTLRVKVAN